MNAKEAAALVEISYDQVRYLIDRNVISPARPEGRKAHEFKFRDLVFLQLAAKLRKDGFGLDQTRQAIDELSTHWKGDNPEDAGQLVVLNTKVFTWNDNLTVNFPDTPVKLREWPKALYDVRKIAQDILWAAEDYKRRVDEKQKEKT